MSVGDHHTCNGYHHDVMVVIIHLAQMKLCIVYSHAPTYGPEFFLTRTSREKGIKAKYKISF